MQHHKTIICIGAGNEKSAHKAMTLARIHGKDFHFVYEGGQVKPGVYHTSTYDYKLQNLLELTDVSFFVLDDGVDEYGSEYDFYHTGMFVSHAASCGFYIEYSDERYKNDFYNIITNNNAICIMPWIAIHKTNWGDNSCCIQNGYHSIEEVKSKMLAGEQHNTCSSCYDQERQKAISMRITTSVYWSQRLNIQNLEDLNAQKDIKYFDLRLSNKCNAMCRSCDPRSSNLIDNEYQTLGLTSRKIGITKTEFITKEQIYLASRLYFAGGEPLIHEDFLLTLEELKKENKLDTDIIVNTNASVVPQRMLDAATEFTDLKFVISIDGIKNQLTYIRWPINWRKFSENVQILNQLAKTKLHFNVVVSIYNISTCYEIFKWITDNYPNATIRATVLLSPYIQQAKFFPNKSIALENIQKIKTLILYKDDKVFASIVNMLEQQLLKTDIDINVLKKFFEFNDILDKSRNAYLKNFIPELEECRKYVE